MPLPEPLPRSRITPPDRLPIPPLYHKMSSPLDRIPISALIPPRSSSKQNLRSSALQAPAAELPRISLAQRPVLHSSGQHRSYATVVDHAGRPRSRSHTRPRAHSNRSDTVPILYTPSLDPMLPRPNPSEDSQGTTLRNQSSRDAVQRRELIDRENWNRPYTSSTVNWPFFAGTALTSSTASVVRPEEGVNGIPSANLLRPIDDGFVQVPVAGAEAWQRPGPSQARGRSVSRSLTAGWQRTVLPDANEKPSTETK